MGWATSFYLGQEKKEAMPRRKIRGIWPVDLPKIKQHVLTGMYDGIRTEADAFYKEKLKIHTRHIEDADLWWVAKPMAILASHAKETLPETQTLADNRPSLAGIVIFEGGTGITTEWLDAPKHAIKMNAFGQKIYPQVEIVGLVWAQDVLLGLTDSQIVPPIDSSDKAFVVAISPSAQAHLEKLLMTTWLLAEQPHIGVSHPHRGENLGRLGKPHHEGEIRVIKLRETPTHPDPWEKEPVKKGKKWAMKYRTVVSGHWRNQPYGPGLASTRPIYIEPYLKGPSDAPIIIRPTVKVWNR